MAGSTRGIPENSSRVIPRLICANPADVIEFVKQVFGAAELSQRPGADGKVAHALMTIGPSMVMIEAEWPTLPSRVPTPDGRSPVVLFVYVENVDEAIERAVAGGATILVPIANQFWGDRIGWIMDPAGHVWTVATRVEETSEAQRSERWTRTLKGDQ